MQHWVQITAQGASRIFEGSAGATKGSISHWVYRLIVKVKGYCGAVVYKAY